MTTEQRRKIYDEALIQVQEAKKVPVITSVYRWGPKFEYAVGTRINSKGILELSFDDFSQIHRDIEQRVSECLDYKQYVEYYRRGEEEAHKLIGCIGFNRSEDVRRAKEAYYKAIFALFPSIEALQKYIPEEIRKQSKNRLELVSKICCLKRPDLFKRFLKTITDEKRYDNDEWGKNTIVIARFCKEEPMLL